MTSSRRASTAAAIEPAGDGLGDARHAAHLGQQLARAQQRLRRHAGVVRALAADQVLLDERDLEPAVGDPPGADLPGGPAADDDDVELPLGHSPQATGVGPRDG